MVSQDSFPANAENDFVATSTDVLKNVLVKARASDVPEYGDDHIFHNFGLFKVLCKIDKTIPHLHKFFHDEDGQLIDNDEYVFVALSACYPLRWDPENPGKAMSEDVARKIDPVFVFWERHI